MSAKIRLDQLLVTRGLAKDVNESQALILSGKVRVEGLSSYKAGSMIPTTAGVEVRGSSLYVSRGGYKLAHALDIFHLEVAGLTAIDAGASTGGFTDVLLQRGVARVYAIDVGYGELHWKLRNDARVVVLERTNVRTLAALPEGVKAHCGVVDVSFISLELVLPAMQRLLLPNAWFVALIKPQFEARREQVEKGGVIKNEAVHREVLHKLLNFATTVGLHPQGLTRSPITGEAGNIEFLAYLQQGFHPSAFDIESLVEKAVTAHSLHSKLEIPKNEI